MENCVNEFTLTLIWLFVCVIFFYFHHHRCHTFGIGSEACHELVLGVAALSNGRHALVSSKDRLQEKVRMIYIAVVVVH